MSRTCRICRRPIDRRTLTAGGEVCFDCATGNGGARAPLFATPAAQDTATTTTRRWLQQAKRDGMATGGAGGWWYITGIGHVQGYGALTRHLVRLRILDRETGALRRRGTP